MRHDGARGRRHQKEEVDRLRDPDALRGGGSPVLHKRRVQSGERVFPWHREPSAAPGRRIRLRGPRRGSPGSRPAGRGRRMDSRGEAAVDETREHAGRLVPGKHSGDIRRSRRLRRPARRTKSPPARSGRVGIPPVLVLHGRETRLRKAGERIFPQPAQPAWPVLPAPCARSNAARYRSLVSAGKVTAAPPLRPPFPARGPSRTRVLRAPARVPCRPDLTIRPSTSTWTKSGTM